MPNSNGRSQQLKPPTSRMTITKNGSMHLIAGCIVTNNVFVDHCVSRQTPPSALSAPQAEHLHLWQSLL
ncbi:hypothetical protein HO173_006240 [Letharia columbiana]|uniref:Uncharacterized protein n=1 Tax=Letharia columbiana TaxID=112416 RepID=A0A8H6FVG8_9LECA|nr:uncharacterized protein HO173_006240 [Letharia columbiana]KAF6235557.1 hypothetical protein HO173_006240 [Letharia columbiana]